MPRARPGHMDAATLTLLALMFAQATDPMPASPPPDVAIFATVRARELKFSAVPNVSVTFRGQGNETVWKTDRENLPDKVQPFVLYRDIGIRLTITSTLPNIEQIVDEALAPNP